MTAAHWAGCDSTEVRCTARGVAFCGLCGISTGRPRRTPSGDVHRLPTPNTHRTTAYDTGCSSSDAQAKCETLVRTTSEARVRANGPGFVIKAPGRTTR